jgi:hypothetical protein
MHGDLYGKVDDENLQLRFALPRLVGQLEGNAGRRSCSPANRPYGDFAIASRLASGCPAARLYGFEWRQG